MPRNLHGAATITWFDIIKVHVAVARHRSKRQKRGVHLLAPKIGVLVHRSGRLAGDQEGDRNDREGPDQRLVISQKETLIHCEYVDHDKKRRNECEEAAGNDRSIISWETDKQISENNDRKNYESGDVDIVLSRRHTAVRCLCQRQRKQFVRPKQGRPDRLEHLGHIFRDRHYDGNDGFQQEEDSGAEEEALVMGRGLLRRRV